MEENRRTYLMRSSKLLDLMSHFLSFQLPIPKSLGGLPLGQVQYTRQADYKNSSANQSWISSSLETVAALTIIIATTTAYRFGCAYAAVSKPPPANATQRGRKPFHEPLFKAASSDLRFLSPSSSRDLFEKERQHSSSLTSFNIALTRSLVCVCVIAKA